MQQLLRTNARGVYQRSRIRQNSLERGLEQAIWEEEERERSGVSDSIAGLPFTKRWRRGSVEDERFSFGGGVESPFGKTLDANRYDTNFF